MDFLKKTKKLTCYTITDEIMMPTYQIGDAVFGKPIFPNEMDISYYSGTDCIIKINNYDEPLFRRLKKTSQRNYYDLVPSDKLMRLNFPHTCYYNVQPVWVAPVQWIHRCLPLKTEWMELKALLKAGWEIAELSKEIRTSERTLKRWIDNGPPPYALFRKVLCLYHNFLDGLIEPPNRKR